MGWGNHHASYDEPCTQGDVLAFQLAEARETASRHDGIRDEDERRVQEWKRLAGDMTPIAAKVFWDRLFPRYRYHRGTYYGPIPPEMPTQPPPTPALRAVESPLWWATRTMVVI